MPSMGIGVLGDPNTCILRKFRWMINIEDVAGDQGSAKNGTILPPSRAARPSLSFKEMEAQHLNETIFYPGKPDWKPINITLYGVKKNPNPIFSYVKRMYDIKNGKYNYPIESSAPTGYIIPSVSLDMVDGAGNLMERWIYEDCWFQSVDFGSDLDMSNSDVVMIEITMRYARAYIEEN